KFRTDGASVALVIGIAWRPGACDRRARAESGAALPRRACAQWLRRGFPPACRWVAPVLRADSAEGRADSRDPRLHAPGTLSPPPDRARIHALPFVRTRFTPSRGACGLPVAIPLSQGIHQGLQ